MYLPSSIARLHIQLEVLLGRQTGKHRAIAVAQESARAENLFACRSEKDLYGGRGLYDISCALSHSITY